MCLLKNHTQLIQIDKLRLKTIRVLFPLHREALAAYLSPILGQYAIKNNDFISEFIANFHIVTNDSFRGLLNVEGAEAGSSLYNEQVLVPLILHIYKGGKFIIKINRPAVGFLFSTCFKKRRRFYRSVAHSGDLIGFRNYKKLVQISFFKLPLLVEDDNKNDVKKIASNNIFFSNLCKQYKETRNALHQRR